MYIKRQWLRNITYIDPCNRYHNIRNLPCAQCGTILRPELAGIRGTMSWPVLGPARKESCHSRILSHDIIRSNFCNQTPGLLCWAPWRGSDTKSPSFPWGIRSILVHTPAFRGTAWAAVWKARPIRYPFTTMYTVPGRSALNFVAHGVAL